MFKFKVIIPAAALVATLVAIIGCGGEGQHNAVVAPPAESGSGRSDGGSGLAPLSAYTLNLQTISAIGDGHSCATYRPKNKAKEKAIEDAKDKLISEYRSRFYVSGECSSGDYEDGIVIVSYSTSVLSETRGDDCGWDVRVKVTGCVGIRCYSP